MNWKKAVSITLEGRKWYCNDLKESGRKENGDNPVDCSGKKVMCCMCKRWGTGKLCIWRGGLLMEET